MRTARPGPRRARFLKLDAPSLLNSSRSLPVAYLREPPRISVLVEHPARMECGVEVAAAQFSPSYRRARVMQATLAVVCLLSSVAAWLAGATFWWAVAGVLLGSVIPFTLIVILPTNRRLLQCRRCQVLFFRFFSTLLHPLRDERHFALVEISAIPTRLARNQFRSESRSDPCISSVTTSIMITTSNSSLKRSGLPNQLLDVLLHTIACSELARVRTELS
jgi:hypothetical protein